MAYASMRFVLIATPKQSSLMSVGGLTSKSKRIAKECNHHV
jgi:hypothetical protein